MIRPWPRPGVASSDRSSAAAALTVRSTADDPGYIPRFQFSEPLGDGSVLATDRVLMSRYLIYAARSKRQLDAGHVALKWYIRQAGDVGSKPASRPFDSRTEAIAALRDGSWDLIVSPADRRPVRHHHP